MAPGSIVKVDPPDDHVTHEGVDRASACPHLICVDIAAMRGGIFPWGGCRKRRRHRPVARVIEGNDRVVVRRVVDEPDIEEAGVAQRLCRHLLLGAPCGAEEDHIPVEIRGVDGVPRQRNCAIEACRAQCRHRAWGL